MSTRRRLRLLCLALTALPALCAAQNPADPQPLFANDTPLELTIEAPFRTLSRARRDREEVDGLVRYVSATGKTLTLDVQIRTRGNSRMNLCTFPPLRLDFRRRQVEDSVFAGQNRLKLVTLCKDLGAYRDYLALEFTIYRLLDRLTDNAYRVRWVDVEYLDSDDERASPEMRPAFLIESDEGAAARTGMQIWETDTLMLQALEPTQTALVSVFQFMIGNTDWSGTSGPPGDACCHNMDVLRDANGLAVLVPYDFDQAGLINADYAEPAADLSLRSVRQRLYRGYCLFNDELDAAFDRFDRARADIEAALVGLDIRDSTKRRVLRYVASFFEIIDDEGARSEAIYSACRG